MAAEKKVTKPFKACVKCKALVKTEETKCPICGSTEFTFNWSGIAVILDPANSQIAKLLGITKPGRYALKLTPE